jgi:polysaccharide pyruvyl transferase WcaK-like protein
MSRRVLVVNAWGMNRGDEAMQRALIRGLTAVDASLAFTVISESPVDLPGDVDVFLRVDGPSRTPFLPLRLGGVRHAARRLWHRGRRLSDASCDRAGRSRDVVSARPALADASTTRHLLSEASLVISAPSGPCIGDCYPAYEPICLEHIVAATRMGTPTVIAATSAGPFNDLRRNALRRWALDGTVLWTLREPLSYEAAQRLALPRTRIEAVADLVFAQPPLADVWADAQTGSRQGSGKSALDVREELESLADFVREPTIGVSLNTTHYIDEHGRTHVVDLDEYAGTMAEFLGRVAALTGCRFLFFPHHCGAPTEMRLIERVTGALPPHARAHVVPPSLDSDAQRALMGGLAMHISHRYHPTIFALQQGVPVFCIVHQFKAAGLLSMFDYPVEMPTTLTFEARGYALFTEVWRERERIAARVRSALPNMQRQAVRTLELIAPLIRT